MTPERQRTIRRLAVSGVVLAVCIVVFLAWVTWLLVIEGQAVAQGGDSTISRVVWGVWASEPWVVLLVNNVLWAIVCTVVGIVAFLGGHFFGQRRATYDAIRRGEIGHAEISITCILAYATLAALASACAHARPPDLRPELPPKLSAHLAVFPPLTIAWQPVTLRAWVDDPEGVFPCPSVTWTWPNGTHSSHSEDCDPEARETRHSGGFYRVPLPSGEWDFRVDFESQGRRLVATATHEVK